MLSLFSGSLGLAEKEIWPEVVPLQKSVYFADAHRAEAKFTVTGTDETPLYLIECHTWEYEGDRDFDYSGDFECRLKSLYSKDTYSTLFTDNPKQSRDWESRARFLAEELVGKCGDYPEYGRVRHFRLRGMKITLTMDDLRFKVSNGSDAAKQQRPQLDSFLFGLQVESDPSALSAIAEPVPFAEPPRAHPQDPKDTARNCEVVVSK